MYGKSQYIIKYCTNGCNTYLVFSSSLSAIYWIDYTKLKSYNTLDKINAKLYEQLTFIILTKAKNEVVHID